MKKKPHTRRERRIIASLSRFDLTGAVRFETQRQALQQSLDDATQLAAERGKELDAANERIEELHGILDRKNAIILLLAEGDSIQRLE